jgi:hypothetical protein
MLNNFLTWYVLWTDEPQKQVREPQFKRCCSSQVREQNSLTQYPSSGVFSFCTIHHGRPDSISRPSRENDHHHNNNGTTFILHRLLRLTFTKSPPVALKQANHVGGQGFYSCHKYVTAVQNNRVLKVPHLIPDPELDFLDSNLWMFPFASLEKRF